jgi:hypothetical protein
MTRFTNRFAWMPSALCLVAMAGSAAIAGAPAGPGAAQPADKAKGEAKKDQKDFNVEGYYCEACSCKPPCPCEMTEANGACKGVGAYHFTSGKYDGKDISGARVAYALHVGDWVNIYIDAKDDQKAAVEAFARAALAGFGPIKSVKSAKVEMTHKDGHYTVSVDGGKVFSCQTDPVMGGDKKTPIVHQNTQDALNPTMYQGTCVSCEYKDGDQAFKLDKGRNAYFNDHMSAKGKI